MNSFARAFAVVRASVWSGIALRIIGFVGGLLLLAWVGRVATAAPSAPSPVALPPPATTAMAAVPAADGGAPPAPPAPSSTAPAAATASHGRATADDPVFVNRADASELRRLPGVGPKRAEAIVALRQRVGRFQRIEELLRVKGVGRATLRKWRPLLRLDSPAPPADAGGAP